MNFAVLIVVTSAWRHINYDVTTVMTSRQLSYHNPQCTWSILIIFQNTGVNWVPWAVWQGWRSFFFSYGLFFAHTCFWLNLAKVAQKNNNKKQQLGVKVGMSKLQCYVKSWFTHGPLVCHNIETTWGRSVFSRETFLIGRHGNVVLLLRLPFGRGETQCKL